MVPWVMLGIMSAVAPSSLMVSGRPISCIQAFRAARPSSATCWSVFLHLVEGYGHRELRVQDGKLRHQAVVEHVTYLEVLLGIGNHAAAVHLRPRSSHRQDATYGQNLLTCRWVLLLEPELVPIVKCHPVPASS